MTAKNIEGLVTWAVEPQDLGRTIPYGISTNPEQGSDSIESILVDKSDKMWAICYGTEGDYYATQINFCPFTGTPAKVKRDDYEN